jgi:DNA-binding beta-propeller fold protein YncE
MRTVAVGVGVGFCLLSSTTLLGQRPANPALLLPEKAPALDYVAVAEPVRIPAGMTMGAPAAVAIDAGGHLLILTRGPQAFFEFDADGMFVRAFGDAMFTRAHGLYVERDGTIWATDVNAHVVLKVSSAGQVLLTLGTKGEAGSWNEAAGSRKLNQPTGVAVAGNGDVFVSQGHSAGPAGDARVLRFDRTGRLITSWGGKGTGPGQFDVAHGLAIDPQGRIWVADRENQRVQIFDPDGTFVRQMKYAGLPCNVHIGTPHTYLVNGFAGQILQLDGAGRVLAATGRPGTGPGEFGEAHSIAVSSREELYVADPINATLIKFVRR